MSPEQERHYDSAMFSYSQGDWDGAVRLLEELLGEAPDCFEARLSLGMAHSRLGNQEEAIRQGERAEALRPDEPLVHTNLSLFHQKAGNIERAEHHGMKARIASWKGDMDPAGPPGGDLSLAGPRPRTYRTPQKFPDMPWKKKPAPGTMR